MATTRPEIIFVVTIDTEEEWDWSTSYPKDHFSVENGRHIPKFQQFCRERGVKPTYFVDYPIAADAASVDSLKAPFLAGECEVGAHLHAWATPPVEEEIGGENTHAVNLPLDLVKRKLRNLTRLLEESFETRPTSFRSGRWGINGDLLKLLAEQGYDLDSSVHPFYADNGFSYYHAPDVPYWPDLSDCIQPGTQRRIFEIPVTSGFNRPAFRAAHRLHQFFSQSPWTSFRVIGVLWRLRLLRKLQLSPELADAENMIALIKACLRRGHRLIHLFFHSSSLLPGGSPYVSNEAEKRRFYQSMDDVIAFLTATTKVRFCTLTEARQLYLQEESA